MADGASDMTDPIDWAPVSDTVRRFIVRRFGRTDFADDIAQETILRVIEYGREQAIDNVYAFALRVASNLAAEHHRRESRWSGEAPAEEIASMQPSPERIVEGRLAVQALTRALEGIPPLRREVIIRRRVRHQSCAEIAEDLGISVKAVEKHVTRALLDLNKALESQRGRARKTDGSDQ